MRPEQGAYFSSKGENGGVYVENVFGESDDNYIVELVPLADKDQYDAAGYELSKIEWEKLVVDNGLVKANT